jgi:hypothetical protein
VDAVVMGLILAWVMLAVLLALGYGLFKRYGRVLIELEELKHRLASPRQASGHEQLEQVRDGWTQHALASVTAVMGPNETPEPGLPIGAPAPGFTLPTLAHRPTPLSLWRGRPVLLLFVRPAEAGSQSLLKRLAQMTTQPSVTSPTPFVVMLDDSPEAHAFI